MLWPGIGSLLLLAITLAGTLYYFSREYTHTHTHRTHTCLCNILVHRSGQRKSFTTLVLPCDMLVYSCTHCFKCSDAPCRCPLGKFLKYITVLIAQLQFKQLLYKSVKKLIQILILYKICVSLIFSFFLSLRQQVYLRSADIDSPSKLRRDFSAFFFIFLNQIICLMNVISRIKISLK